MRCLHCGNKISLLRKLKDSEFCSDEHRDFYALQQQQLAVSRLMETSSPRHIPLPGLRQTDGNGRALPKASDRRGLAPSVRKADSPVAPAAAPIPAPLSAPVVEPKPVPPPPPPPIPAAPALNVAAEPSPVAAKPAPSKPSGWAAALDAAQPSFVSQFPLARDVVANWKSAEDVWAVDLMPILAAPRLEHKNRRRVEYARMLPISGSFEWSKPGAFIGKMLCEETIAPSSPATISEILSLSLNGFVCDRALTIDTTVYQSEEPVAAPAPSGPSWDPPMPVSAEAGLGVKQLPAARRGLIEKWPVEATALPPEGPGARPIVEIPGNSGVALRGRLPEIDWTVERLDRVAERNVPGLVRLRVPRARSPQLARLVKPAAGSSGPPIRVRPTVKPPKASHAGFAKLAMPSGPKVPLRFDAPVPGNRSLLKVGEGCQDFASEARMVVYRTAAWSPGMALAGLVALQLKPAPGLALSEGSADSLLPGPGLIALPRGLFVQGSEFDPPSCGMVRLILVVQPQRGASPRTAVPAIRPVVSYRWIPIKPELQVSPDANWSQTQWSMAPLSLAATAPGAGSAMPPSPEECEPMHSLSTPSLAGVRLGAQKMGRSSRPGMASRMFPISLEDCVPKAGSETPVTKLEDISPKPAHQYRKSTLKTQADWERNRWTSASMYGSALWRIAIGKFSGALDQAPKTIRWGAGLAALALAAFAIFPSGDPSAPADTGWTMANKPGPAVAGDAAAAPSVPAPRRPKAQPAAVRAVAAKAARQPRTPPAPAPDPEASVTSAWGNFQKRLSDRAAVAFTDDFRNGLAEWEGAGDWARSWSYDASGFVRTGGLAVLAQGSGLTDYRTEFLGQIERRSMGWVVRAADLRNYYALKLTIVSEGPVPQVALIRYPVINGVAGAASQQLLPIEVRSDTVYRVQTEVRDDYFAVTVQGKVVDSWTDARLKRGSIGLFSGKGELARVRWVGIWHQYDTLGRLCALLAPGGLPGKERGANQ